MTQDWSKPWSGFNKAWKHGITFNEGAGPFNFTLLWNRHHHYLFIYVYVLGLRRHFSWVRKA